MKDRKKMISRIVIVVALMAIASMTSGCVEEFGEEEYVFMDIISLSVDDGKTRIGQTNYSVELKDIRSQNEVVVAIYQENKTGHIDQKPLELNKPVDFNGLRLVLKKVVGEYVDISIYKKTIKQEIDVSPVADFLKKIKDLIG